MVLELVSNGGEMTSRINVLVVEDNVLVASDIQRTIKRLGCNVIGIAYNYDQAIELVLTQKPDLIFMDIDLGPYSRNGIEATQNIQVLYRNIAIVYLTAHTEEEMMYEAYSKTKPIAYLAKPFEEAHFRSAIGTYKYSLGKDEFNDRLNLKKLTKGYYFDSGQSNLYYEREPIALTRREKIFFNLLVSARGDPVSRQRFEEYLWNEGGVSDNTFRTFIYRLRNKVGGELIQSNKGLGYSLHQ